MSTITKDYNTSRPQMVIPEYGRNIQKMVAHAISTEDREERNKIANAIISVMGQLQPHLRDIADFKHKLWDHLFVISDFKLDVDSPYPMPDKEVIFQKPEPMTYPQQKMRFKHYGKGIEDLINEAIKIEDEDKKKVLTQVLANLMKKTYLTWNRDSVDDELIFSDLKLLSKGQLKVEEGFQLTRTQEILAHTKKKRSNNPKSQKHHNPRHKQNNYKKKRY